MAFPDESAAKIQCNTQEGPARTWHAENWMRLEVFLSICRPNASRESIRRALAAGACRVDGIIRPMGFRLTPGAAVTLDPAARIVEVLPQDISVAILYEDAFLLAVNKPAGMLVHPTGAERTGTMANALRGLGFSDVRFLHRLDRGTSGVLLAAKTLPRRSPLAKMFQTRQVEKRYLCAVAGPVEWETRTVNASIGRDPLRRPQWDVLAGGAEAETRLQVAGRTAVGVLLAAEPVTGRTNQIRIHCASIGHPLLGDAAYGGSPAQRLFLHAWMLTVPTADSGRQQIVAPPPSDFLPFTASF